jgi:hypothetical protein
MAGRRMTKRSPKPLPVLGWREWVALPGLGVGAVKAKVDTGARSSAIHAFAIERFQIGKRELVRFQVHPLQRSAAGTVECQAEVLDERHVRPSAGTQERRIVIRTELECAGERWPIELTLASRDQMGFRMLLGREAIRRRFWIDPGRSYLTGRRRRRTGRRTKADPSEEE